MCKCAFYDKNCKANNCKGTEVEWHEGFTEEGRLCGMVDTVYVCPSCDDGLAYPTYDGKVSCNKCDYETSYEDFANYAKKNTETYI